MDHKRIDGEPFILSEDKARGMRIIGWYEEGDTGLHYQMQQEIPETFFKQTQELDANWSPNDKRKTHWQQFASIPDQLKQNWCAEFGVKELFADEDVSKKIMQRLNSNEFSKLRTGGGNL